MPCVCEAQGVLHSCHYFWLVLLQKYAIAEFDIPYAASRAKKALDQIENSMKPDQNKRGGGSTAQVKLLRSEFAAIKSVQSQFSKILFVSNLPPVGLLPGLLGPCAHTSYSNSTHKPCPSEPPDLENLEPYVWSKSSAQQQCATTSA